MNNLIKAFEEAKKLVIGNVRRIRISPSIAYTKGHIP